MYDLLVKGGKIIDPAQKIHGQRDIAISQGKIAELDHEIATSKAKRTINASNMLVTPGLIDLHTHVADAIIPIGIAPDEGGVLSGVTTVCDSGSTGHANFPGFKKFVVPQARTDVFCFINLCSTGLSVMPEIWSWRNIDLDAIAKIIEDNKKLVKGIKLRAIGSVAENLGVKVVEEAKRLAVWAGLPLVLHIGKDVVETTSSETMDAFTRESLSLLDNGDILTHVFTWKPGEVIKNDGSVLPEFREAMERGVILDIAHGSTNFSFKVAQRGLKQGILPSTLSTDLANDNINGPVFSLLITISKFIALGLTLDQVIAMATINPARALGEEHRRGSLRVDIPADVSILEMIKGNFIFSDGKAGNFLRGRLLLIPKITLKAGVEIPPKPHALPFSSLLMI